MFLEFLGEYKKIVETAKERGIYSEIYTIEGPSTNPEITVIAENGERKKVLMFSSNNYLGMANDERIKKVVAGAVQKYGMGSGGSRLGLCQKFKIAKYKF